MTGDIHCRKRCLPSRWLVIYRATLDTPYDKRKSSLKKISGSTHTHTYTPHDVQQLSCTHSLNYLSVSIHILAVRLFFIICFRVLLRITHSFPSLSLYDFFLLYRSLLSFALTLTPSHMHCSLPFVFFWFFFFACRLTAALLLPFLPCAPQIRSSTTPPLCSCSATPVCFSPNRKWIPIIQMHSTFK